MKEKEFKEIVGGTNFGECVLGAWGAAAWKLGPIGALGTGLGAELAYMGQQGCFG